MIKPELIEERDPKNTGDARLPNSLLRKRVTLILILVLGAGMITLLSFYNAKLLGDGYSGGIWPGFYVFEVILGLGLVCAVVKVLRAPDL